MEDKDPHGALGPVDGGRHICVGFFDQHDGGVVEERKKKEKKAGCHIMSFDKYCTPSSAPPWSMHAALGGAIPAAVAGVRT